MSDQTLRSSLIRIASELPQGDETRRKILATFNPSLQEASASREWAQVMKDIDTLQKSLEKLKRAFPRDAYIQMWVKETLADLPQSY